MWGIIFERVFLVLFNFLNLIANLIKIRDMVVECCNRQFGRKTIHPTKKKFCEFVANVLRGNIGILFFDLHGGC